MAISIQCAQCGQTYKVRDDLAGKRVECKCGQALAVPQPSPDPEAGALPGQDPTAALLDDASEFRAGLLLAIPPTRGHPWPEPSARTSPHRPPSPFFHP